MILSTDVIVTENPLELVIHYCNIFNDFLKQCIIFFVSVDMSNYLVTSRSRVLLEKLTSSQLVKTLTTFYEIRRFITAFTSACHLSLSSARSIQSMPLTIPFPEDQFNIII